MYTFQSFYLCALMGCVVFGLIDASSENKSQPVKPRRDSEYPPAELLDRLRPIHDLCVPRTGVTEASIVRFSDVEAHHDDEALKCYMACVFEESNVLGPDGDVHLETLYSALPDSMKRVALKMGVPCLKVQGVGRCERAFWLHLCWKRADPVHYFLI